MLFTCDQDIPGGFTPVTLKGALLINESTTTENCVGAGQVSPGGVSEPPTTNAQASYRQVVELYFTLYSTFGVPDSAEAASMINIKNTHARIRKCDFIVTFFSII